MVTREEALRKKGEAEIRIDRGRGAWKSERGAGEGKTQANRKRTIGGCLLEEDKKGPLFSPPTCLPPRPTEAGEVSGVT